MTRVPVIPRGTVPEEYRALFDEVMAGREVGGPSSVLMHSPEMGRRIRAWRDFLGDGSMLSLKVKELVRLTTARGMDSAYIWNSHAASGLKAGLSRALLDALREGKPIPADTPSDEAAVIAYGLDLFRTHKVSQQTFDAALKEFGAQGVTELTGFLGYYSLIALTANAFDVDLPPAWTESLPPV